MKRTLLIVLTTFFMSNLCSYAQNDLLWSKQFRPYVDGTYRDIKGVHFAYGDSVAVAVAKDAIFLIDANTGEHLKTIEITDTQNQATKSYKIFGQNKILTRYKKIILWDLELGDTVWTQSHFAGYCAPSKKEPIIYVLTSEIENKELIKLDVNTGEVLSRKQITNMPYKTNEIFLSTDEKYLFQNTWKNSDDNIEMYDMEADTIVFLPYWRNRSNAVSFSPNGKWVASANSNESAIVWDVETKEIVKKFDLPDGSLYVMFSDDSKYLIFARSGFSDHKMIIVNTQNWELLKEYNIHPTSFDISEDYSILACDYYNLKMFKSFVGVEEQNSIPTILYPNPSTNIVNIKLEQLSLEPINISIYDEMGSLVTTIFDGISNQTDFVWNTEAVPSGVYFCKIDRHSGITTTKIIVAR